MVWRAADWRKITGKVSESEPYEPTYRTCGYCGSIHPEDLVTFIAQGATLHGSDWKYGWPHKFYVEGIPNPIAGKMIPEFTYYGALYTPLPPNAERDDVGWRAKTAEYPAPPTQAAKWYNLHLLDQGYDTAALTALIDTLYRMTGILFHLTDDNELRYSAPFRGYQR
jgi:hypothetical protein